MTDVKTLQDRDEKTDFTKVCNKPNFWMQALKIREKFKKWKFLFGFFAYQPSWVI